METVLLYYKSKTKLNSNNELLNDQEPNKYHIMASRQAMLMMLIECIKYDVNQGNNITPE